MSTYKPKPVLFLMLLLAILGLVNGCLRTDTMEAQQSGADAEGLLNRVLDSIQDSRGAYTSYSEVVVGEMTLPKEQRLNMQGEAQTPPEGIDPYESLLSLREIRKTVEVERNPGSGGKVIVVRPDPDDWTARMRSLWEKRIHTLQEQGEKVIQQQASRLTGAEAGKLEQELNSSLELARSQMERMVQTMSAEGDIQIILQVNNRLPKQLIIESKQSYEGATGPQAETVRTIYDFVTETAQ